MRVTGGSLAGRRFHVARHAEVRPTADRVRESMFARLGDLSGARVLDLFAGSGALGIEAMSRGADTVVFVDRAQACVACVRENLRALGLESAGTVLRSDARGALSRLQKKSGRFDLVFLDPPYASDEATAALNGLATRPLLAPAATVVLEADHRHDPGPVDGLRRTDERRYGDTVIAWYSSEEPGGGAP